MKKSILIQAPFSFRFFAIFVGVSIFLITSDIASAQRVRSTSAHPSNRFQKRDALTSKLADSCQAAYDKADQKGWSTRCVGPDQQEYILTGLTEEGWPIYNTTLTTNVTISSGANLLHPPAAEMLDGNGVLIGIWDAGSVRTTHQDFNQTGSSRITVMDGAPLSFHATSVTGVALAGGIDSRTIASCPLSTGHSYDLINDFAEIASRASTSPNDGPDKIQVSNHSYGPSHGWAFANFSGVAGWHWLGIAYTPDGAGNREDAGFGYYSSLSEALDQIAVDAPYYLHVRAIGNDRSHNFGGPTDGTGSFFYFDGNNWQQETYETETAPFRDGYDRGGYDTTITAMTAKNIIAVGAVHDAVTAGARDPSKASMTSFSGWGPTDDGRIKPDVVSNGQGVRLTSGTGDANYGSGSGTSFAAPGVTGVVALLIQHARNLLPGWRPLSSTLKALVIHAATDLGRSGPDYIYGWGLINAPGSAQIITDHADYPNENFITESELGVISSGRRQKRVRAHYYRIKWEEGEDLVITLCWIDPAFTPLALSLDNPTSHLVNDLDLMLWGRGSLKFPYVLNPAIPGSTATTGNNTRDNVEQIRIPKEEWRNGSYFLRVSHKGSLVDEIQSYSLIISGQKVEGPLTSKPEELQERQTAIQ